MKIINKTFVIGEIYRNAVTSELFTVLNLSTSGKPYSGMITFKNIKTGKTYECSLSYARRLFVPKNQPNQ